MRYWMLLLMFVTGCAPRQKRTVYPPLPGTMRLGELPYSGVPFVNADAITIQVYPALSNLREWELHSTNYLSSTSGPLGKSAVLTFPTETEARYHVEGKHLDLAPPQPWIVNGATNGWTGTAWRIRSMPFHGTGDLISVTQAVVGTEFFRVRKLD